MTTKKITKKGCVVKQVKQRSPRSVTKGKATGVVDKKSAYQQAIEKQLGIKTSYVPTGHRVLVKKLDAVEKSAGGILLPDVNVETQSRAVIVRIGANCKGPWKPGHEVIFRTVSGDTLNDFKTGETDGSLCILHEDDIIASTGAPLREEA